MVVTKDRRQFARAEVSWSVTILSPDQSPVGEIKSISQVGASIYCQKLPPAGRELGLEIKPPNRQTILVFAKQVWAIDADSSESPHRFILGYSLNTSQEMMWTSLVKLLTLTDNRRIDFVSSDHQDLNTQSKKMI